MSHPLRASTHLGRLHRHRERVNQLRASIDAAATQTGEDNYADTQSPAPDDTAAPAAAPSPTQRPGTTK